MSNELTIRDRINEGKFVQIFAAANGLSTTNQDHINKAKAMLEKESFNFMVAFNNNPDLEDTTELSQKDVFLEVIENGLSFSKGAEHVYLMYYTHTLKVKTEEGIKEVKEKRLAYSRQPNGAIFLCQRAGVLDRLNDPVIVYEGDEFDYWEEGGRTNVRYKKMKDAPTKRKIIAGFVCKIFPDKTFSYFVMDLSAIERLKAYSAKKFGGNANALYTSNSGQIDVGFLAAKLKKHACNSLIKRPFTAIHEMDDELIPVTHQISNNETSII